MPKSSGQSMRPITHRPPVRPASRPINHQTPPAPGPHHKGLHSTPGTPSNKLAAEAVRIASSPGGVDPTQQRF
jgi:hypothetical protein